MPVDNRLYDTMANSWWDEGGCLHILRGLNPARFGYMRRVLVDELGIDPRGKKTLDVGCGGGILAEEFARLGCDVTGIDPSEPSIGVARSHARQEGLAIDYRTGTGEALPFPDAAFDLVYCCDVLEHVNDVGLVVAEIARVLRSGGLFFYDTINRTFQSKLVVIKIFQEWRWTSFMPPNLHDWRLFIKPEELTAILSGNGFQNQGLTGLKPATNPLQTFRLLRARKRGEITYLEAAQRLDLRETADKSIVFMGWARRIASVGRSRSNAPP
ncbi:MAG TPA: bifunctional 2-polyprenyl-6-hydroxyphenol methylase/3-demethylubiquinol 3-O-methyltransferase UbiG [Thermoanaerobaculia bacterium]|jgi:2-polyprenyl-6-hydroxyphenyl methylase/3-demethylubiquinone-9 3-methyltransferase|nr:bifunctional 2-polyprenyl-6-hydroxyphenol methylase/3-demethylubiquinol 3-O-methyltransferase UbiG [Thermoanaerobaculia bacterium]